MASNKKFTPRRPKTATGLAQETPAQRNTTLTRTAKTLNDRIERLECFIAAAPSVARQQKLARINIVPPMEQDQPNYRRSKIGRLPMQQQVANRKRRIRLLIEVGIVGIGIAGLAGWLNQFLNAGI
jgi:hypothetical protein